MPQTPSRLRHLTENMHTLTRTPNTPSISSHRHDLLLLHHIVEVGQCALELPPIDRLSCFAGVFEGDTEVGTACASGLGRLDRGGCVADLVGEGRLAGALMEGCSVRECHIAAGAA